MDLGSDDVSCDLCLEEFKEPARTEECSHVFCSTCLQKASMNGSLCPLCWPGQEMAQSLDGLPSSRTSKRVVPSPEQNGAHCKEETSNRDISDAENPQNPFNCFLCNHNKQHVCLSAGNLLKILRNGQRILPEKAKPDSPDTNPQAIKGIGFCAEHDLEEMKFYCETCRRGICRDCAFLDHKTHKYVYYKNRKTVNLTGAKETFQKIFTEVEKKKRTLEDKLASLEANLDKRVEEIEAEKRRVLFRSGQMKSLIAEQEKALICCLDGHKSLMAACVDTKKAVLRAALDEVSQGLELAKGAFKREDISKHIHSVMKTYGNKTETDAEDVSMETCDLPSHLKGTFKREDISKEIHSVVPLPTLGHSLSRNKTVEMNEGATMETCDLPSHLTCLSPVDRYKSSLDKRFESSDEEDQEESDPIPLMTRGVGETSGSEIESDEFESESEFDVKSGTPVDDDDLVPNPTPVMPMFTYHSSLGGKGTDHAAFEDPVGIATSSDGTLAIADYNNDRVQLFTSDGALIRVLTHVETEKGRKIALLSPTGVAFDKTGNLVIAERGRHRITVTDPTGKLICKFGKLGKALGHFRAPHGVSVDRIGRIIVADTANNRVQVFDNNGEFIFKFGDKGEHKLDYPNYAILHNGSFYVSDTDNDSVKVFDKEGTFLRYLCTNAQQDPLRPVQDHNVPDNFSEDLDVPFSAPSGLAVYRNQYVLVCDYNRDCVKVFSLQGQFLTEFGKEGTNPGEFCGPEAIAVLPDGRVVVSDKGNNRLQMFK